MAKSVKRRNYKKSKKANKKNIKRVSLKKLHRGHKLRKGLHYSKGLHKRSTTRYGGIMCGGMVSSPASGPVGYSWNGGNIGSWPGVQASQGLDTNGQQMSNHFSLSKNGILVGGIDPARSTSGDPIMKGGKRQKGGFFQEMINLGRGAQYGLNSGYSHLIGKTQPISQNPYPTESQPIDGNYKYIGGNPSDVRQIFINANKTVAKL